MLWCTPKNQTRVGIQNLKFKAMKNAFFKITSRMNNLIYSGLILLCVSLGCTKNEPILPSKEVSYDAKQVMGSSTILRNQIYLNSYGIIEYDQSISTKLAISETDSAIVILIPITKNGYTIATLEAIKLPANKLPHQDDYAINLVDYRKYNLKTQSGEIKMVDLNYDLYIHSIITVENNHIKAWNSKGLSKELQAKYNYPELKISAKQVNTTNQTQIVNGGIYSLCDKNGDQNISFSECYKCVSDAISADGFSNFVCEIPILGWASCWASKSAACVVLSSAY
jgi:hypothetical protein